MKVLGIGNAIVDVICKVEDSFLSENSLTKSTMKLVDEAKFKIDELGSKYLFTLFYCFLEKILLNTKVK